LATPRRAGENYFVRFPFALLLVAQTARAERHVIARGETLQHVAEAYACSVAALLRANHLDTTLLAPGTVIEIPKRTRAKSRSLDDRARAALAVIDGATWVGKPLARGDGYLIRRPEHAFGAAHVVDHLKHAIGEVRALYPDVHTLAIGDISAEHGGKLASHLSHRTGLDVDIGFYYKRVPDGYPEHFAPADGALDLEATWALITAFARSTELEDGVAIMFLDYDVQRRLYRWAEARGTPEADLAQLFQYPRGQDAPEGIIRHWPNHADHIHVRFKSRR